MHVTLIYKYNLQLSLGILWFIFCTGLLTKLNGCECCISLVATNENIAENSKFHQCF